MQHGVEDGGSGDDQNARPEENHLDSEILKLRQRWELASVLNFLDVSNISELSIVRCRDYIHRLLLKWLELIMLGYEIVKDFIVILVLI